MMLLIGSTAAQHHYPGFREPKDYDIICLYDDLAAWAKIYKPSRLIPKYGGKIFLCWIDGIRFEFEIADPGTSAEMVLEDAPSDYSVVSGLDLAIATPRQLYVVKKGHITSSIKWHKHIDDYHFFKSMVDPNLTDREKEIVKKRRKETEKRIQKKKKPSLSMKNNDFFTGTVDRIYEHDDIHHVTCFYDDPLFDMLKEDKNLAKCEKSLFDMMIFENQIKTVQEEAFAIALERKIIPALEQGESYPSDRAYQYALMRICTTLTSGWFREFAIENYPDIKTPRHDFVQKFLDAVKSGKIKRKEPISMP